VVAVFVFRRPLARFAVTVAGVMAATAVGLSRLELGVHWPSDVMAGWALGTTAALIVILGVSALGRVVPPEPRSSSLPTRLLATLNRRRPLDAQPCLVAPSG
jgi:membrane-associated phospholipid phosphatase